MAQSDAQKEQIQEAREAANDEKKFKRSKRIMVGDWSVGYFDPYNYAIERVGSDKIDYWPTIESAFQRLLSILIKEKSAHATSVKEVVDNIKAAKLEILEAVKGVSFE